MQDYSLENMIREVIEILGVDVEIFREMDERKALDDSHHGLGTFLRNKWFWHPSEYYTFFNKIGLYHADDMSGTLLKCTHRHLNNKSFDLKNVAAEYIKYWRRLGIDPKTGEKL